MGKKLLHFMGATVIVLTLVLTGAASAWAKDTAQLDYSEIATRLPKENKTMEILQRRLPLVIELRSDLADMNRSTDSLADSMRALQQQYGSAISDMENSDPTNPNLGAMKLLQGTLGFNQAASNTMDIDSVNLTVEQMQISIPQTEAQLINSSQQLFVGYHQLQDGMKKMQANRVLLEESLSLAKTQLNAGLGTALAVKEAELAIAELDTAIKQMETQGAQMLNQLKLLVGWPQEQIIKLGSIPRPNREFLGKIKIADDVKNAQNSSYSLKLKQAEYKYNDDDDEKNIIKLEIEAKKEEISLAVSTQYYKISEANNTLLLEEERLAVAEEKIKQARLQHQLGLMSELVLQSEETSYTAQKDTVITAMDSLFWEIENYKAIVAGLN